MSADRFETELRDLLRSEAASAPVQMSVADLRARAGRRWRWSWAAMPPSARLALAGGGIAAIAVALAFSLIRGQQPPDVGSSPSPSGPGASAQIPPVASGTAIPSARAFDPGPSGSLILSRVGADAITIVIVGPDGTERVAGRIDGLDTLASISPDAHLEDDAVQAIGSDGDVLITIESGDGDAFTRTNALVRIGSPMTLDRIVPRGMGVFGPDGRLVIVDSGTREPPAVWVVDPARPADARQVAIPDGVSQFGGRPRLSADGTGLVVADDIVLGLDGSTRPLVATEPLFAVTNAERLYGSAGQRLGGGCDTGPAGGSCVLLVIPAGGTSPNGTNIGPNDNCCGAEAWTPDGDSVVMISEDAVWLWDGTDTKRVAGLPADVASGSPAIAGFVGGDAATGVVIESFSGTTVLPLNGRPAATHPGVLVAVVR